MNLPSCVWLGIIYGICRSPLFKINVKNIYVRVKNQGDETSSLAEMLSRLGYIKNGINESDISFKEYTRCSNEDQHIKSRMEA